MSWGAYHNEYDTCIQLWEQVPTQHGKAVAAADYLGPSSYTQGSLSLFLLSLKLSYHLDYIKRLSLVVKRTVCEITANPLMHHDICFFFPPAGKLFFCLLLSTKSPLLISAQCKLTCSEICFVLWKCLSDKLSTQRCMIYISLHKKMSLRGQFSLFILSHNVE